jgi:hypothetical protein
MTRHQWLTLVVSSVLAILILSGAEARPTPPLLAVIAMPAHMQLRPAPIIPATWTPTPTAGAISYAARQGCDVDTAPYRINADVWGTSWIGGQVPLGRYTAISCASLDEAVAHAQQLDAGIRANATATDAVLALTRTPLWATIEAERHQTPAPAP